MHLARLTFLLKLLTVLLLPLAITSANANDVMQLLNPGGRGRASKIVDGDTIILQDGRQIRLVGIQAPKLPLSRPNFKRWPLAEEAKQALMKLVMGKDLQLAYGGERIDRHGRTLAHLFAADGTWIQAEMLRMGLARVYTFPDNRKLAAQMYAIERQARSLARGIWKNGFYAILSPDSARQHIGTLQIVTGTVLDTAKVKGNVYLNFGPDWRTDFTIMIPAKALHMFARSAINPLNFKGEKIRVRGWLKRRNGPMIKVSHPEQIEYGRQ